MLTTFYPPYSFGGDAIGLQRFSRALVKRGHSVTVILDVDAYNVLSPGPEPDLPENEDGIEIIPLRSNISKLSILLTQQFGRPVIQGGKIRQLLAQGNYDVIMFNNVSLVGGPGLLAYGDALKIYMAHEHWLVCPSHVLWRHGKEVCTKRECLRCVLHYKRPPQIWRYTKLLDRMQKHVDAFIAMSEFSKNKHREFGFKREMEVVNYFLPDSENAQTQTATTASPHQRPYFLFVGRLEKIKGLDDVIPVFEKYKDADLLIAGDGEYTSVLKDIAKNNPRVVFLGRVDQSTLEQYYQHAIALIVPSVCYETFGIILIESLRKGTPVLARRIGPFPEIVSRSQGGMLFDGPEDLVDAMKKFQHDSGLRDQLSKAGREGFVNNWSEDAVMPRFFNVIKNAARKTGRTELLNKIEGLNQ